MKFELKINKVSLFGEKDSLNDVSFTADYTPEELQKDYYLFKEALSDNAEIADKAFDFYKKVKGLDKQDKAESLDELCVEEKHYDKRFNSLVEGFEPVDDKALTYIYRKLGISINDMMQGSKELMEQYSYNLYCNRFPYCMYYVEKRIVEEGKYSKDYLLFILERMHEENLLVSVSDKRKAVAATSCAEDLPNCKVCPNTPSIVTECSGEEVKVKLRKDEFKFHDGKLKPVSSDDDITPLENSELNFLK